MPVDGEVVRQQLERVLDSRTFRNADRLRAFLRFVVNETLADRKDEIKEYSIGREVCGRPASFDPKADPIVRVDANRLRSRLQTYYQTEGIHDEVRFELPKGAYIPLFKQVVASASAAEPGQASLAVLPFVNLGPPGEYDYFSDSLTEELIHSLARLPGLRVIARSSVFQFKDREDARRTGMYLKADHVLEGSVRVAGGRLRITAQLLDVAHGWLVWSEQYEREWQSVFAVQDEITASITDALKIRLSTESAPELFTHVTENPEAYADYLRGRYHWHQRTAESLTVSIRWYEQALERDPCCAAAYAGIADTLTVMALNDQEPTLALMPRARAAARKAIELRPGWSEALTSSGCVKSIFDWDWEGGAKDLEEATRRRPGSPTAHYFYGIINLAPRGRWTEAVASIKSALRLDPVSPVLLRDFGLVHFMRRAWDEAEEAWRQAEEIAPAFRGCLYWRARLAIETGRFEDAITALETRLTAGPANTRALATMAYALARHGAADQSRAILNDLTARARQSRVPALDFATIWLGLRQWEQALHWLEKACEDRAATLYQFAVDPLYDCIRDHPRAEALRLAMGLPQVTRR